MDDLQITGNIIFCLLVLECCSTVTFYIVTTEDFNNIHIQGTFYTSTKTIDLTKIKSVVIVDHYNVPISVCILAVDYVPIPFLHLH